MASAPTATRLGFSLRAAHLVSDQRQRLLSSMPTIAAVRTGFEKQPSARGYPPHPRGVKRQRSISLGTFGIACGPQAAFSHEGRDALAETGAAHRWLPRGARAQQPRGWSVPAAPIGRHFAPDATRARAILIHRSARPSARYATSPTEHGYLGGLCVPGRNEAATVDRYLSCPSAGLPPTVARSILVLRGRATHKELG
jgi:hypothetical protein